MELFQIPHFLPKALKSIHKIVQNIYSSTCYYNCKKKRAQQQSIGKGYNYYRISLKVVKVVLEITHGRRLLPVLRLRNQ